MVYLSAVQIRVQSWNRTRAGVYRFCTACDWRDIINVWTASPVASYDHQGKSKVAVQSFYEWNKDKRQGRTELCWEYVSSKLWREYCFSYCIVLIKGYQTTPKLQNLYQMETGIDLSLPIKNRRKPLFQIKLLLTLSKRFFFNSPIYELSHPWGDKFSGQTP